MTEFKTVSRKNSGTMSTIAKGMTDAEVTASADYFARLPLRPWTRIVEASTVPKTYVGQGNMPFVSREGGTEPIGQRIIELPDVHRSTSPGSSTAFSAVFVMGSGAA